LAAVALTVLVAAGLALSLKHYFGGIAGDVIEIAVVYSPEEDSADFLAGVQIAIDQVNTAGGLLGHPVAARLFQEDIYTDKMILEQVVAQSLQLATRIAEIPSVLAVIGHGSSATAIPASGIYDRAGKLFLATHATATSLSNHRFDLTFALQPNNADNAAFLAQYAHNQGLRRIVVLSDNSGYGIETTDQFRSLLTQDGGTVLYRGRLTTVTKSVEDLLLFLLDNDLFKASDIDAFFVTSAATGETAQFIVRARQLGLKVPILGPEYLYSHEVEDLVGMEAMRDVVAVSIFDGENTTPEGLNLHQAFVLATGHTPGLMAAIGFDAVKVLAYAVKKAGTLAPDAIADTLRIIRYDGPYIGATGPMVFDSKGLATDNTVHVVRHDGTRFRTVAAFRKPLVQDPNTTDSTAPPPSSDERKSAK
jgi:branched-chain amino acid transport system substrate-binding protein